jgi:acyl-CoA thioesterase
MDEVSKPTVNGRQQAINDHILNDPFARWLGARVEIVAPGHSRVYLTVTPQMVNFHGITHGGVVFAISDMAFAAASNSHGQTAVALNVAINFLKETRTGDRLVAEANQVHAGGRTALYSITVREEESGALVAQSQDLVYRKRQWFVGQAAEEG